MSEKLKVAIIGSTGYGGIELIRLLATHPLVEITSVISSSSAGMPIAEWFPHLTYIQTALLDDVNPEAIKAKADLVFTATPAGVAAKLAPQLIDAGLKVIDLSGDFRLQDTALYEKWYKKTPSDEHYLKQALYALPEINGDKARDASFISNPGCFVTSALLGLVPAVKAGWIDPSTIIIDAKTGVSGAGRGASLGTHYSELNENFKAYKVNQHQHVPEIEMMLSEAAGHEVVTTFTPHLVPMTRGIMSTMYAKVKGEHNTADFIELYKQFYEGRQFVRVRKEGVLPMTKEVWGSNYCDLGFNYDARTGRITIVSVIDNLVKGASGQAIQNLNLMMGWDEGLGLQLVPVYP
jgi:N-acetyl-gamma-glutamyl-phosphate reductase